MECEGRFFLAHVSKWVNLCLVGCIYHEGELYAADQPIHGVSMEETLLPPKPFSSVHGRREQYHQLGNY